MVVLSGCAPEGTASTGAAEAFHRAVSGSDMTAACALLQPHTREETARSSDDGSCESQLQKVTAAGCRPNGEESPYTCEVGGN
jgi:hypothetical protein